MRASDPDLWEQVDALVERAPSVDDLLYHRLAGIAARKWRREGRALPAPILEEERFAPVASLAAQVALTRTVEVFRGAVMVLKGPEVASRYPDPALRPYHDLDLLVDDPRGAHRALVAAGCSVTTERLAPHHELPLAFPDLPVMIELHRSPKWPLWHAPPASSELFAAAVPAAWANGQALAPAPAHHAVLLAAHAWAHGPLARMRDLLDVEVMMRSADPEAAHEAARRWGLDRAWAATLVAARAVLQDGRASWPLHVWARNLRDVRRRTRAEQLVASWMSPFWALPPARAAGVSARATRSMVLTRSARARADRSRRAV